MYDYLLKFAIIGDSGIGKTSIMRQFLDQSFLYEHDMTIGVDFGAKTIHTDGKAFRIQVWDTAGQESFKCITRTYYRNVCGILLCYDVNNRESFNNVTRWMTEIQNYAHPQVAIILVGTKIDMNAYRQVSFAEGQQYATEKNLLFIEVSSKTKRNIIDCFTMLTSDIYKKLISGVIQLHDGIKQVSLISPVQPIRLNDPVNKINKSGCCY